MIGIFQRAIRVVRADPRPERPVLRQWRIFNGVNDFGFIILAFFSQLANALGIGGILVGKALRIAGLPRILGIGLVISTNPGAAHAADGTGFIFEILLFRCV